MKKDKIECEKKRAKLRKKARDKNKHEYGKRHKVRIKKDKHTKL